MPNTRKKFDSVRAARLSLLLTLGLTVGIGTAIYKPLDLKQSDASQTPQVAPTVTSGTTDFGRTAATSALDFSDDAGQDPEAGSGDSSLNIPRIVQSTEAPVLTTTQAS